MSVSNELPEKCHACAKSVVSNIPGKCKFCRELEFHEEVLCHLNRCIQNPVNFRCHAYQPRLKLASPSVKRVADLSCRPTGDLQGTSLQKLLRQDKIKYERALALQKLERDPDGVYMELKYHLAWNVIYRGPVFMPNDDFFDFFHNTFLECSELVGGLVSLLGLAPDHVHLYLESDEKNSVETVVQEIKRFSKSALLSTFVDLKDGFEAGNELWDNAYFSETIG